MEAVEAVTRAPRQLVADTARARRIVCALYLAIGALAIAVALSFDASVFVWVSPAIALFGALAFFAGLAIGEVRPHRLTWLLLLGALVCYGTGDFVFGLVSASASRSVSVPSLADLFYLAAAALTLAAALVAVGRRISDRVVLVDTLIAVLAFALGGWVIALAPLTNGDSGLSAEGLAVAAAYPLVDVVAIAILLRLLLRRANWAPSVAVLAVAIAAIFVSDIQYLGSTIDASWVESPSMDLGYCVGYLLWGLSALVPPSRLAAQDQARRPARLPLDRALTIVSVCAVPPLAFAWAWNNGDADDLPVIVLMSAALTVLWTVRMTIIHRRLERSLQERRELEAKLIDRAERDPLVGLFNRAAFARRLFSALVEDDAATVLCLDLDDFKVINDTLGHAAGDEVLVEVANRIRSVIRPFDVAARLGGDEFAILVTAADADVAESIACRILDALREPIMLENRMVYVHTSIGISAGDADKRADEFLREADVAMYLAKAKGKGRYEVFEESMHNSVVRRIALRGELEDAITRGEFTLLYQPIVEFESGRMVACEALVRWLHPDRGILLPAEFVAIAEETGLIVPLGQWILEEACRQAKQWQDEFGSAAPAVSINVSALQFRHPTFMTDLVGVIDATGVNPKGIILELTESALIDTDHASAVIPELRDCGIRIAIDDFGTGYSSLAYIARYPIDVLKLDRVFVAALGSGGREERLASAVLRMSEDLRIRVVAEGVETADQLQRLRDLGCDYGQGFLLGRPQDPFELAGHVVRPAPNASQPAA